MFLSASAQRKLRLFWNCIDCTPKNKKSPRYKIFYKDKTLLHHSSRSPQWQLQLTAICFHDILYFQQQLSFLPRTKFYTDLAIFWFPLFTSNMFQISLWWQSVIHESHQSQAHESIENIVAKCHLWSGVVLGPFLIFWSKYMMPDSTFKVIWCFLSIVGSLKSYGNRKVYCWWKGCYGEIWKLKETVADIKRQIDDMKRWNSQASLRIHLSIDELVRQPEFKGTLPGRHRCPQCMLFNRTRFDVHESISSFHTLR